MGSFYGVLNHIELSYYKKRAIRLITNSSYIACTLYSIIYRTRLTKSTRYVQSKQLKFYLKLSSNLFPQYFESYRDVIERAPARELRQHCIHPPLIRRVYAECSPLFLLIKLINFLKADKNYTILEKIKLKSHTFHVFSFNVTMVYLNASDPICRLNTCYPCNR